MRKDSWPKNVHQSQGTLDQCFKQNAIRSISLSVNLETLFPVGGDWQWKNDPKIVQKS